MEAKKLVIKPRTIARPAGEVKPIVIYAKPTPFMRKDEPEDDDMTVSATGIAATIERYHKRIRNPQTAIRAHCIGCSGGSSAEVDRCPVTKCALHPFRKGKNPFRNRNKGLETDADTTEQDQDESDDEGQEDGQR